MDIYDAIDAMHERSGLGYERISSLIDKELDYVERVIQDRTDIRLDVFAQIVETCGYTLTTRKSSKQLTVRSTAKKCIHPSDVSAHRAISKILGASDLSYNEIAHDLGMSQSSLIKLTSKRSAPWMSFFLELLDAAGFTASVRKFRESYVLQAADDVAVTDESRFAWAREDIASNADEVVASDVGLSIHEAFREYEAQRKRLTGGGDKR